MLLNAIFDSFFISYVQDNFILFAIGLFSSIVGIVALFFDDKKKSLYTFLISLVIFLIIFIILLYNYNKTSIKQLKPDFITLENSEFNYQIQYPDYFSPDYSDNSDVTLTSKDKHAHIIICARKYDTNIPNVFTKKEFLKSYDDYSIIYEADQLEKDGWYAILIKSNNTYYYHKCIATNNIAKMYTFSFPVSQREYYNSQKHYDYVDYIENSFRNLN